MPDISEETNKQVLKYTDGYHSVTILNQNLKLYKIVTTCILVRKIYKFHQIHKDVYDPKKVKCGVHIVVV